MMMMIAICCRLFAMAALICTMTLPQHIHCLAMTDNNCPSACSFISPVPYPFGAAPGCGAPGFQLSNCSVIPQWNLRLGDTIHVYYVKSIGPTPNSSNHSSVLSYGYGGAVVLTLPSPNTSFCQGVDPLSPLISAFSTSDMYAFQEEATLSFYQQRYLLFNCTAPLQVPPSGILTVSSQDCSNYLKHCKLATTDLCVEYSPDMDLYLPSLMTTYNCSSFRRFIIANEGDPVETWTIGTQFAWGPVQGAESCSTCQNTGGTCGYNTQDNSFLCYCGNEAYTRDCGHKQSGKGRLILGLSLAFIFLVVVASSAIYLRHSSCCWRLFGNRKHIMLDGIHETPCIKFPFGALAAATKSFTTEVGAGAFGKVYRGVLPGGSEVAVKVLDAKMSHGHQQFTNEVATIGNIHHMNIARLFGYSLRRSKRLLVYEYVCNGSLDKYLFQDKASASLPVLSWKQRFHIALGVARGLFYMHEECRSCIIHCDIKPQNILLDASYCPKIADFGLARLLTREESRVLTHARGTPGYVAPEFWSLSSGPLTSKFDVYSYGVLLLEIVRGERSFRQLEPLCPGELEGQWIEWSSVWVDTRIKEGVDLEQARLCTLVALWCIQADPSLRPTMGRVVHFLQGTALVPSDPPYPFGRMEGWERRELTEASSGSYPKILDKEPSTVLWRERLS